MSLLCALGFDQVIEERLFAGKIGVERRFRHIGRPRDRLHARFGEAIFEKRPTRRVDDLRLLSARRMLRRVCRRVQWLGHFNGSSPDRGQDSNFLRSQQL